MTLTEAAVTVLASLTAGGGAVAAWVKGRSATAQAREQTRSRALDHDAAVSRDLLDRMQAQDERIDALRDEMAQRDRLHVAAISEAERGCQERLDAAEQGCQQRIEERIEDVRTHEVVPLREGFLELARRWREERGPDDTGVREIGRAVRRIEVAARRTPPEMPAQRLTIPPPPRGRKDD